MISPAPTVAVMLDEKKYYARSSEAWYQSAGAVGALARLRDVFGDQLLTPAASGKGMVLTSARPANSGNRCLALRHLEDVVSTPSAFDPQESDRTFTVGANDNATAINGSRVVALMRRNGWSGLRLAFRGIDFAKPTEQSSRSARSTSPWCQRVLCPVICPISRCWKNSS